MFRGCPLSPDWNRHGAVALGISDFRASCKVVKLWHAMRHGKQRQGKTRSQKAEEEGPQAGTKPPGHNLRRQAYRDVVVIKTGRLTGSDGMSTMDDVTSLQGPVDKIDGKLTLLIPLEAGGDQFIECSRGIGEVCGKYLKVEIQEWLADSLRIQDGDLVSVNNANGKFNIQPVNPRPLQ